MNGVWTCHFNQLNPNACYKGVLYWGEDGFAHALIGELVDTGDCPNISPRLKELGISSFDWLEGGAGYIKGFWSGAYVLVVIDSSPGIFWIGCKDGFMGSTF
jgi:hypothetical protein